jgi:hypothetical protein
MVQYLWNMLWVWIIERVSKSLSVKLKYLVSHKSSLERENTGKANIQVDIPPAASMGWYGTAHCIACVLKSEL